MNELQGIGIDNTRCDIMDECITRNDLLDLRAKYKDNDRKLQNCLMGIALCSLLLLCMVIVYYNPAFNNQNVIWDSNPIECSLFTGFCVCAIILLASWAHHFYYIALSIKPSLQFRCTECGTEIPFIEVPYVMYCQACGEPVWTTQTEEKED